MELSPPMVITSRLMAGVHVGCGDDLCEISIEQTVKTDRLGKPRWRYFIDVPFPGVNRTREHSDDDLAGWGDAREMLASLLAFLSACAESRSYYDRSGQQRQRGDNADMFPDFVGEWAQQNSDELGILSMELEAK